MEIIKWGRKSITEHRVSVKKTKVRKIHKTKKVQLARYIENGQQKHQKVSILEKDKIP